MKFRAALLSLLLILTAGNTLYAADENFTKLRERYETAKKLYESKMYVASEREFDELSGCIIDKTSAFNARVEAGKTLCAIALRRADMEGMVMNFEKAFPHDPQVSIIKFKLAEVMFDNSDYETALSLFEQIRERSIFKAQRIEYRFKKAYCYMRMGKYEDALKGFIDVSSSQVSSYTYPSIYYTAYVYYIQKEFKKAFPLFEKSKQDTRFVTLSSYYAIECRFMTKNYDYVVSQAPALYESLGQDLQKNLARMLSESYFAMNDNSEAKKYLDLYVASGGSLSRKDNYLAGVVSYSLGSYEEALNSFSDVVGNTDTLGQSSYYYSANSYLKSRNKIAALKAFKMAADCDFDKVIKEDAMFNYAKLSFDVNSDISQFENYVNMYPKSGKDEVINTYMSAAFLAKKDYVAAIEIINRIKNPSREVSANLQKAALARAIQIIDDGGFRTAMPYLQMSLNNNYNQRVGFIASYWLAECNYRNDNFSEALRINNELISNSDFRMTGEYPMAIFTNAYSFFKSGNFAEAIKWFNTYSKYDTKNVKNHKDALLRIADSYFMLGSYEEAASAYENVTTKYGTSNDLYAEYQCALSYGLTGNDLKKISILKDAVDGGSSALLYPQVLYELGRTYVQRGSNTKASECFNDLLNRNDSTFYSKALLELALINANLGEYDRALKYYERIIRETPMSECVQDAVAGVESIYEIKNKPEEFLAFLDKVGMSNVKTAGEKEQMLFNSSEQIYLSGNYPAAMNSLQSFLSRYPNGVKSAQAYFYLAESLKATGRNEAAADAYYQVMKRGEGDFAEAATLNYARISYKLGHYNQAADAYESLSYISKNENNKQEACSGMMMSYYKIRKYDKAINEAQRVLNMNNVPDDVSRKAKYVEAKSYRVTGYRDLAKPLFVELSANTLDEIGGESTYILIQDLYDAGDFEEIEKKVYEFSDSETPQVYWLAKCFIVLGDTFADQEKWKQARATFESIKKGYQPVNNSDDVPQQVEIRLNKLKSMGK